MLVLLSLLCLLLVGQTQALQIENDDFEILDDEDVDEPVVAPKNNEYDEDEFETAKWVPPPNSPKETKPQPKLQPAVKHVRLPEQLAYSQERRLLVFVNHLLDGMRLH